MSSDKSSITRTTPLASVSKVFGKAVAVEPSYGCGKCPECAAGRISQCPGATRVGGFAERVALPVACVLPLPKGLDPATAALTEPAACCLSGLEQIDMLPEAWQGIAQLNPVVHLISGYRWAFFGLEGDNVMLSLGVTAVFIAVLLAVVSWMFKTGYRLKN